MAHARTFDLQNAAFFRSAGHVMPARKPSGCGKVLKDDRARYYKAAGGQRSELVIERGSWTSALAISPWVRSRAARSCCLLTDCGELRRAGSCCAHNEDTSARENQRERRRIRSAPKPASRVFDADGQIYAGNTSQTPDRCFTRRTAPCHVLDLSKHHQTRTPENFKIVKKFLSQ